MTDSRSIHLTTNNSISLKIQILACSAIHGLPPLSAMFRPHTPPTRVLLPFLGPPLPFLFTLYLSWSSPDYLQPPSLHWGFGSSVISPVGFPCPPSSIAFSLFLTFLPVLFSCVVILFTARFSVWKHLLRFCVCHPLSRSLSHAHAHAHAQTHALVGICWMNWRETTFSQSFCSFGD